MPNIIITDKECVDKTYPDFWYDLEHRFGVKLSVPSTEEVRSTAEKATEDGAKPEDSRTVVIVGMRGSGKSTMGRALANRLNWKFIDVDLEFEAFAGEKIKDFVEKNGWPAFRVKEEELVRQVIDQNPREAIVSTGGGIVETPTALEHLQSKKKACLTSPRAPTCSHAHNRFLFLRT